MPAIRPRRSVLSHPNESGTPDMKIGFDQLLDVIHRLDAPGKALIARALIESEMSAEMKQSLKALAESMPSADLATGEATMAREAAMRFAVTLDRDEDGAWVVACPAIPGCISQGETRIEALENIREAIALCLEVRAERGMPLTLETSQVEVAV